MNEAARTFKCAKGTGPGRLGGMRTRPALVFGMALLAAPATPSPAAAASAAAEGDGAYVRQIEEWRTKREAGLRAEEGWLSVVGLDWLKEGPNTVGSAKGADVVLPASAPAHVGVLERSGTKVTARLEPAAQVTEGGRAVTTVEMKSDASGHPDTLAVGSVRFYVIERGDRLGVRVKDAESPARKGFHGLQWFPVQPSYRITARWVPHDPVRKVPIANVLGMLDWMPSPGEAVFTIGGREQRLDAVLEEPEARELFFIFRDRTAGKETYPAGRFLYAEMPTDGTVVLDFNKAYSPPCAFTTFATCPLPPKENRLGVRIEAGEKKPAGH